MNVGKILRNISRVLLAGILIFELLNQAGILNYTLTFTWLGLILTASVIWLFAEIVSSFLKKYCDRALPGWEMAIITGAVYIDALGDILRFYGKFSWYDQLAHFLGGMAATSVVFSVIYSFVKYKKMALELFGIGFFSVAAASFFGALYEIEEYLEDYYTGSHRLGGGPDTANDLMLNLLGSFLAAIIAIGIIKIIRLRRSANKN